MSFSKSGLQPIGATAKASSSPVLWSYQTADTYAQVRASGYFNSIATLLKAGDIIVARTDTGGTPNLAMMRVAAVTSGVVTTGPLNAGGSGGVGVIAATIDIQAVAQLNTDFTLPIPSGATILRATTWTTTAFTGNTATLQLGSTAGGTELVAAVNVKSAGRVNHTIVEPSISFGSGTLYARLVQTATVTAVGTAKTVVEYLNA